MLSLGALAFATPWVLAAALVLPIIWLLLRVTPPAPKQLHFPAITFLFGLTPREETPAHTPWWLLLLRILLAALVILGLAHPLLNPRAQIIGGGPLVLVLDDGWAAARDWTQKQRSALELTDQAERDNRPMVLLTTAPEPGGDPPLALGPQRPADIRAKLQALTPHPWPADRAAALAAFGQLGLTGTAESVWIADGLDDPAIAPLAERLQRLGSVMVLSPADADLPDLLLPPENTPGTLDFTVKRATSGAAGLSLFRAVAGDGHLLDREPVRFDAGQDRAVVHLKLPIELRNNLARADLEGQDQVGATLLLDERWQRRPVGVVSGSVNNAAQSLLDDDYYIERALGPFAELRRGPIADLLHSPLSLILLPDSGLISDSDRGQLEQFIAKGGVLVRFAGANLAGSADTDTLLPVRLRGSRTLGSALQWTQPVPLAGFEVKSPFAGLAVPNDVTVSRQVLAEPSIDLADRTWARLADGTPLVTAEHRGEGWLVLFHVPATADWSNLPISGVFVEMLRRLVSIGQGVGAGVQQVPLPAQETLDGFAHLGPAPGTAAALQPGEEPVIGPKHPPGFYGTDQTRRAINLTAQIADIAALKTLPQGVVRGQLAVAGETDLRPWLLSLALAIGLLDILIGLALRGLLVTALGRGTAALLALFLIAASSPAWAQDPAGDDPAFALKATLQTHLAYVTTGDRQVDDVSLAGLRGLTLVLNRRTAVEAEEPMAVDVEHDELAFFPLLYWPIVAGQPPLSPDAVARINFYLRNGGTILFDTRDTDSAEIDPRGGEGQRRLQQMARGLDIPQLIPVPPEHVLTKAFYLMQGFPGRFAGGTLWVEAKDSANDEVSSVIVGSNDYAAAWAVDRNGRPMFATSPGGELQREQAFRFGVNLMMYALTGNYKTDQVHVPSILERLGQ
jgi:hypothetical protein